MEFEVVPLRRRPDLRRQTAKLLNTEWPRSLAARLASLEEGEDDLPCSLVLLHKGQFGDTQVAGHVRLIAAAEQSMAALVEALLVSRELRGQGHGSRLMQAAEEYVACRGYHTLHLSTHDMQGFYRHLGYQDGPPVTALRSCVAKLSSEQVQMLLHKAPHSPPLVSLPKLPTSVAASTLLPPSHPQPPPPPPLPQSACVDDTLPQAVTWLQKTLT